VSVPLIVAPEQWPHGLRCMDCDVRLTAGSAYSKRLVAIAGTGTFAGEPTYVVEIVCAPCALGMRDSVSD